MKIYDKKGDLKLEKNPYLNVLLGDYYKIPNIIIFNKSE